MKFRDDGYNITRKAYKKARHLKRWERYKAWCEKNGWSVPHLICPDESQLKGVQRNGHSMP